MQAATAALEGPLSSNPRAQALIPDLNATLDSCQVKRAQLSQAHSAQYNTLFEEASRVRDAQLHKLRALFAELPDEMRPFPHEMSAFLDSDDSDPAPDAKDPASDTEDPLRFQHAKAMHPTQQMDRALARLFEVRGRVEYQVGLQLRPAGGSG